MRDKASSRAAQKKRSAGRGARRDRPGAVAAPAKPFAVMI
jgi:hypothetical protein